MQTNLADFIKDTHEGREAEDILRKCVHCGFCTATCPTYQLLGDELDGPRGRIYLIKQVLEGKPATEKTQLHLDRCLTCRNCETTCPSGVQYGRLVDIGRNIVARQVKRSFADAARRKLLAEGMNSPLFAPAMKLGQAMRWAVPESLRAKVPPTQEAGTRPPSRHARRMILLEGCVQPAMMPNINNAAARVLDKLDISLVSVPRAGCCGAVRYHLDFQAEGLDDMRRNVDAWLPLLEKGEAEAIVMTASGCGALVREYGHHLAQDPRYAAKAERVGASTRDLSEIVLAGEARLLPLLQAAARKPGQSGEPRRVAYHPPCTLQHAQQLRGGVERLLRAAGFELLPVNESHLCCGSAGAYSVLNPEISEQLKQRKLGNLQAERPELILSANIGCLTHLQSGTGTPVKHWIEAVDDLLSS
ncbi:MAG TPA: glycolate oxidase subunit GlcF [Burkholderiales bacterium]|jgi:glycolate oxidase iron-sulfur subunit